MAQAARMYPRELPFSRVLASLAALYREQAGEKPWS